MLPLVSCTGSGKSRHALTEERKAAWLRCVSSAHREQRTQTIDQGLAVEMAFVSCHTQERDVVGAMLGDPYVSPVRAEGALAQLKATTKRALLAGQPLTTGS